MQYYERLDPALHRKLNSISIRGVVAVVARFARRLIPRYALASDVKSSQLRALNRAIGYAERFVDAEIRGSGFDASIHVDLPPDDYPADAATISEDPIARQIADGVNSIHDLIIYGRKIREIAAEAVPDLATSTIIKLKQGDLDGSVIAAAEYDFNRIVELQGAAAGQFGERFSATDNGPLGSLWAQSPPHWFQAGNDRILELMGKLLPEPGSPQVESSDLFMQQISESRPEPFVNVCFDDSGFTADEIELFLSYLSEVYRDSGGIGLKVVHGRTLLPSSTEVSL